MRVLTAACPIYATSAGLVTGASSTNQAPPASWNHGPFGIKRIFGRTDGAFCYRGHLLLPAEDAKVYLLALPRCAPEAGQVARYAARLASASPVSRVRAGKEPIFPGYSTRRVPLRFLASSNINRRQERGEGDFGPGRDSPGPRRQPHRPAPRRQPAVAAASASPAAAAAQASPAAAAAQASPAAAIAVGSGRPGRGGGANLGRLRAGRPGCAGRAPDDVGHQRGI